MVQGISTVEQSQVQSQTVEDKNPKNDEAVKDGSSFQSIIAEMFDSAREGSLQNGIGKEEGLKADSKNKLKNPKNLLDAEGNLPAGEKNDGINPDEFLLSGNRDLIPETKDLDLENRVFVSDLREISNTGNSGEVADLLAGETQSGDVTGVSRDGELKDKKNRKKITGPDPLIGNQTVVENQKENPVLEQGNVDFEQKSTNSELQKKAGLEEKIKIVDLRTGSQSDSGAFDISSGNSSQISIGDEGAFKSLFRQIQEKGIQKSTFSQFLSSQIREAVPEIVQQGTIILQNHSQGNIKLFLNPESLGTVKIDLKISENQITGSIKVFTSEAFDAMKDNLENLKAGFIAGGFEDAALNIEYGGTGDYSGSSTDRGNQDGFEFYKPVITEKDLSSPVLAAAFGVKSEGTVNLLA